MKRRSKAATASALALAVVTLVALRVALGKSLGDRVAARERARFEREVGPLDPAHLAAPPVDEADNAVPAIADVAARLANDAAERDLVRRFARAAAHDGAELAALDALLAARRAELVALTAAARRPASSFGPRAELFHGSHVELTAWLHAALLLAADGERALAAGDAERGRGALDALLGMTVAVRREPIAHFAIVGSAVEWIYLDLVRACFERGADAATLARLDRGLASLSALPGAREVMHGEAVFGLDMLRRTPVAPRLRGTARERIEALLWPWSEGHVEAGYLAGWRELAAYAGVPQRRWPPESEIVRSRQGWLRRWLDPTAPFETVRTTLFPGLLSIARRLQLLGAAEQLARLAVDVAAQAREDGALPASLAGFPAATTADAASGAPPRYAVGGDGVATLEAPLARELARDELARADPARRHVSERRLRVLLWRIAPPAADAAPRDPRQPLG